MDDVLIIGGGVIGLSLAWDLARRGIQTRVIDQGEIGREASWAGAGILPPASATLALDPYDQLRALTYSLHREWGQTLPELTGIDTGYRVCGGLYLARTPGEAAALAAWARSCREECLAVHPLDAAALAAAGIAYAARAAFFLPEEAQLRNPRYLQALQIAGSRHGVAFSPQVAAQEIVVSRGQITAVRTNVGMATAGQFCFTSGAWTGRLLAALGIAVQVLPIRGQMVLFQCDRPPLQSIVNEGSRYLVPRDDGLVLVGSTEEEVGFDKQTTKSAIEDLTQFARSLVPALQTASIERTWAGLRPATLDGLPYLGRLPSVSNAFVAAGHFRSGLFLSPATATVMSQLMRGEPPAVDLAPFRVGR